MIKTYRDDNEFARYLASYLEQYADQFIVYYSDHSELDRDVMQSLIEDFLEKLA